MPIATVSEDLLLNLPPQFFFRLLDARQVGALVQKCIRDGVVTADAVLAKADDEEDEDFHQLDEADAEKMAARIGGFLTVEKRAVVPRTDMGIKLAVPQDDKIFQRALNLLTERKRIVWGPQGSMRLVGMGAKRDDTPKAKGASKAKQP